MVLMLVGIGYFAVITGAIAERFIEHDKAKHLRALDREHAHDDLLARVDVLARKTRALTEELDGLRASLEDHRAHAQADAARP